MNLSELAGVKAINGAIPNQTAITNANKVIETLGFEPDHMRSSVEEGVYLKFGSDDLGAIVECYNDGEIGYTLIENNSVIQSVDKLNRETLSAFLSVVGSHCDASGHRTHSKKVFEPRSR